jgi:hypothetical protein
VLSSILPACVSAGLAAKNDFVSVGLNTKQLTVLLRKVALILIVIAVIGASVGLLWQQRFWPFSTGTRDTAFLRTTFGMSPAEVRRALKKDGAELLSYDAYRHTDSSPLIKDFGFELLLSEDRRRNSSLYMPSIQMSDSRVEAEYFFRDDRLVSVSVHFDPFSTSHAQDVTKSLEERLRKTYQYSKREDSTAVPGAYTLHFTSLSAAPSLWVNLTEPKNPIIILTILSPKLQSAEAERIRQREQAAFKATR